MNMELLCVLLAWSTNVILLIIAIVVLVNLNRTNKKKVELDQLQFNFNYEPKESDFVIIDNLIQDNLAQYRIKKLETVEKLYINEDIQKKIFKYVLTETLHQLSPIYLQRLSYIYNKDKLNDIIAQKINLAILEYTIEVNGNIRK